MYILTLNSDLKIGISIYLCKYTIKQNHTGYAIFICRIRACVEKQKVQDTKKNKNEFRI